MAKLVLLVVAAAWAAVLIPPMLRSRVDNRPNSSVTDFRRQLNRLQSTATPPRGSVRGAMGRPLAQSPLQRQAAAGRPGQPAPVRQAAARSGGAPVRERTSETTRYRSHGDPTGGQRRPHPGGARRRPSDPQARRAPQQRPDAQRHARPAAPQANDQAAMVRRRRTNVLFILVVTSACTMFLAATTDSVAMLWAFGLSFIATCGYVYILAQLREREQAGWKQGWLEQR